MVEKKKASIKRKPKSEKIKRKCVEWRTVKTRKPTEYNLFFKAKYDSVKHLPSNERMKAIAKMWKER